MLLGRVGLRELVYGARQKHQRWRREELPCRSGRWSLSDDQMEGGCSSKSGW
jgi:hypothetical protein